MPLLLFSEVYPEIRAISVLMDRILAHPIRIWPLPSRGSPQIVV